MQDKNQGEFAFINEKIKEKPINKKRLAVQAVFVLVMAIMFGLVASFIFTYTQPKMEEMMYPKEDPVISIPRDEVTEETEEPTETEAEPETETETEAETETETAGESQQPDGELASLEITLEAYQNLQNQMYAVGREANKFIVTVTGVKSDTDWFNNAYESKGQASGIVIANNGEELLILTEKKAISDAQEIYVTFVNDTSVAASIKKYDGNTGITVLSVPLETIDEATLTSVSIATLGNSLGITQGAIVLAVGSPLGTNYSVLTGNITSTTNTISTVDANFNVYTTNIVGSQNGSGALINVSGEVIGLVMQGYSSEGDENTLTAVSISELKSLIEMLSNNQDIPYIGVSISTVTTSIANEYEIPKGVYIKEVKMDSPAMAAGLQSGDIITEINGEIVPTVDSYEKKLQELIPYENAEIVIMRQGTDEYTEIVCEVEVSILP